MHKGRLRMVGPHDTAFPSRLSSLTVSFSEFNYVRNTLGDCELVPGTEPLAADVHDQCKNGEEFWYERTAYRVIPYSSCEDGYRQDRGNEHRCPGLGHRSVLFWLFMLFIPFGFTALVAYYYYRRSGLARGCVIFYFPFIKAILIHCLETSVCLETLIRHLAVEETAVFWTPWLQFLGSSLDWLASHMSLSRPGWIPTCYGRGEATGMFPLTRMRKFCDLRTRSRCVDFLVQRGR